MGEYAQMNVTKRFATSGGASTSMQAVAPLLKWPGGKRAIVKHILPLIPSEFGRYFEPFLGGGALFFALLPTHAVLADKNAELINCYRWVQKAPEELISLLSKMQNSAEAYYQIRNTEPHNEIERAARLIYLTTLSFNGIHRVNLDGRFNVPYGYKTHLSPCDPLRIRSASASLQGKTLQCGDFAESVQEAKSGDVVYLDPPYTVAHGSNGFLKYNAKIFSWEDQERLANLALELDKRGCSVLVSNADHVTLRTLYSRFFTLTIERPSRIAAQGIYRKAITECLFHNRGTEHA